MPLDPIQQQQLVEFLTARLATSTMDEIVEQELDAIYDWPHMPNSPTKRLYRNFSLAYSPSELKSLLLRTYTSALDADFTSNDGSPPPEAPPEETPTETPDDPGTEDTWTPQVPLDPEAADAGANGGDARATERENGWDRAGWAAVGVREFTEREDLRAVAVQDGLIGIVTAATGGFSYEALGRGEYDLLIEIMYELMADMFDSMGASS